MEGSDRWQFFMLERQLHNFVVKNKAKAKTAEMLELEHEKLPTIATLHARTLLEKWHIYVKLQSPVSPKIRIGPKTVIKHFLHGFFFSICPYKEQYISRDTLYI